MLIPSKLNRTYRVQNQIIRPHLLALLDQAEHYPLILVQAPAGYGKTTLLSQWTQSSSHMGWYSLDESDNNPESFAAYFYAAMMQALGEESLQESAYGNLPALFTELFYRLQRYPHHCYLVLDDYHHIHNPEIHQAIKFWLKNQPKNMSLVVSSRSLPPLGVANLRVQDQVLELSCEKLCFNHQESRDFFKARLGITLPLSEAAKICDEVGGWATALQLISLANKAHGPIVEKEKAVATPPPPPARAKAA